METGHVAVLCQVVEMMENSIVKDKCYLELAFDLLNIAHKNWWNSLEG
jgi:hypothetical protein